LIPIIFASVENVERLGLEKPQVKLSAACRVLQVPQEGWSRILLAQFVAEAGFFHAKKNEASPQFLLVSAYSVPIRFINSPSSLFRRHTLFVGRRQSRPAQSGLVSAQSTVFFRAMLEWVNEKKTVMEDKSYVNPESGLHC
jgi:hypothetical protein